MHIELYKAKIGLNPFKNPFRKALIYCYYFPTKKFLILAELRKNLFKRSFLTKKWVHLHLAFLKKYIVQCIDFIFRIFKRIYYSLFSAVNRNSINIIQISKKKILRLQLELAMQFQKYIFISKKSFFKKICPYINYIQLDTSGHSLGKQVILCVSKCMYSLIRKKKHSSH